MADAILEVAEIAQQRGPRGAEAVRGVLEERLARAHRVDEVAHMDLVRVARRGEALYGGPGERGGGHRRERVPIAVGADVVGLHLAGERVGGVTGFSLARHAAQGHTADVGGDGAFAADEAITEILVGLRALEVYPHHELEARVAR